MSGDGYSDLTAIDAAGHLTVYGNGLLRPDFGGKPYVGSYWRTQNTNWGTNVRSLTTADVSGDRFADLIGSCPDLPPDMAENHDHYLHGREKK